MSIARPPTAAATGFAAATRLLISSVAAIAAIVLLGWILQVEAMKRIAPGLTSMNPLTAVCFELCCAALWLVKDGFAAPAQRRLSQGLACIAALAGAAKLADLALGTSLCPDDVLFRSQLDFGQAFPSRMAPNTGACIALLGSAIALIDRPARARWLRSDFLVLPVMVIALAALVGYIYNSSGFYEYKQYIPMALHTGVNFLLLGAAVLLSRTPHNLLRLLPRGSSGARSFARLVPACVLVPTVLGMAELYGAHRGWFVAESGASWIAVLAAVAMTVLVYLNAVSLNRVDAQRQQAHEQLQTMVEELQQTKGELEAANAARGTFLANMSHEIRTPMNAIIGLTTMVLEGELTARQRDYIGKVQGSSRALMRILNDILDYSRLEGGRLDLEKLDFNLEDCLRNLSALFGPKAEEKGLRLLLQIAPEVPAHIVGDEFRLGQILNNLVGNAIKFTESGEVHVSVCTAAIDDRSVSLRFAVRDTGAGMTDVQQARLFRAFAQADDSVTRKFGGSGLGLIIAKSIVELMSGKISVDSQPGRGTTFTFTAGFQRSALHTESSPIDAVRSRRALIVDAHPTARDILLEMLQGWQMEVVAAASAARALELVGEAARAQRHFDLVIVDSDLPEPGGVELGRQIAAIGAPAPPQVLLTVPALGDYTGHEADTPWIKGTLPKPLTPSWLFNRIVALWGDPGGLPAPIPSTDDEVDIWNAAPSLRGTRVLLVEDMELNRLVGSDFLSRLGITYECAGNGREAVERVESERFDAVLMDLHMPEMDGLEATRRIRRHHRHEQLPIIAMSAAAMEADRAQCLAVGMNDHIAKPLEPEVLVRTLLKWIVPRAPVPAQAVSLAADGQPAAGPAVASDGPPGE